MRAEGSSAFPILGTSVSLFDVLHLTMVAHIYSGALLFRLHRAGEELRLTSTTQLSRLVPC